ncbi:ABC transporter substrate-binding protein [Microvirga rosea]|nr:ABC transporter substrate-binding protein [Microvirga rosea]MCB8822556.1 ABC transporter substrate-binding protein [Microvirga rosea]
MSFLESKDFMKRAGRFLATASVAASALAFAHGASAQTLTVESWRNDDADVWNNQIIPAFNKKYPNIKVQFKADPPTEYNAALNARLAGGTAGDLITCRPFDASLDLFKKGHLVSVNDVKGMDNFSDVAKSAWSTDDGKTTFCMPMASVIHGFIYNKAIFDELKLTPPKTVAEFHAVLDKIKANGKYTPIAMGTADQWEAATMGFQNIGVNYWKGEEGRKALIEGKQKFTDAPYVQTFTELASWAPYMGDGFKSQKYPDTQNLFTLGRAAIYPAGSWDIPIFRKQADFEFDAFAPPAPNASGKCYISDHTDIALGINTKSKNVEAAKTFLSWIASSEFADIYANALPGFFPLTKEKVTVKDPVAAKFVGWRDTCESSIRNSYQILSRGTPNLENELWNVSAQVLNGTMKPEEAAKKAEDGLASWYEPHKK